MLVLSFSVEFLKSKSARSVEVAFVIRCPDRLHGLAKAAHDLKAESTGEGFVGLESVKFRSIEIGFHDGTLA